MLHRCWLNIAVLLTVISIAWSAELPETLTLTDCLRLSLEHRPSLVAARASVRAAEATTDGQQARRWPSLNANWDWRTSESTGRSADIGGVTEASGRRSTTNEARMGLEIPIYESGLHEAISEARASEQSTRYRLSDTERQLLQDVTRLYYTTLSNEQLAAVRAAAVKTAEESLAEVDARIEVGAVAKVDRLPALVEVAQARLQAVTADSALRQSQAELGTAIGLPAGKPLKLAGTLEMPAVERQLAEWLDLGMRKRPDLHAKRSIIEARKAGVKAAEIERGLSFSVNGHAEYGRYDGVNGDSWWLSAGVGFPVYNRGVSSRIDRARADLEAAVADLAESELTVRRQVEQAYLGIVDARARVEAATTVRESARVNASAAQERYREGLVPVTTVTDALQSQRDAEADYLQAVADYNIARAALFSAAGENLLDVLGEAT